MIEDNQQDFAPMPDQTPRKKPPILVIIVMIILAIVGLVVAVRLNNKSNPGQVSNQPQAIEISKVSISGHGFLPASIQVSPGTQVTWTNSDNKPHQVAADPYPANNSIPGFDSTKKLQKGDSISFVFEKSGTYTYHDQQNPLKFKGTVVVK